MYFIRASAKVYRGVSIPQKFQTLYAISTPTRSFSAASLFSGALAHATGPLTGKVGRTEILRISAPSIDARVRSYCVSATDSSAPTETASAKAASDDTSTLQGANALNVATVVNKIKRQHQQASEANERRKLEMDAWTQLNSLSEEAIMTAEGKAVALLLNSWAYFSKHWQRGRDGPELENSAGGKAAAPEAASEEDA